MFIECTPNPLYSESGLYSSLFYVHKINYSLEQLLIASVKLSRGSSSFFYNYGSWGRCSGTVSMFHERMNYKDTGICLTDFIDWLVFSTLLVNCCPHGRRNYTCVLLPLYLLSDLPPSPPLQSKCSVYTNSVWL